MARIIGRAGAQRNPLTPAVHAGCGFTKVLHGLSPVYGAWPHGIMATLRGRALAFPRLHHAEQRMVLAIRDVREHALYVLLSLSTTAGASTLGVDFARLRYFYEHAEYFCAAEVDGQL